MCNFTLFRSQREDLPVGYRERLCRRNINGLLSKVFDVVLAGIMVPAGDMEARLPGRHVRTSLLVQEQALLVPTPEYPHTRIRRHPTARFAPVWLAVLGCCILLCWCDRRAACHPSYHLFHPSSVQSSRQGDATFSLWLFLCCRSNWAFGWSSPGNQMAAL